MNAFTSAEMADRLDAVRQHLTTWGVDGLLVVQPENRRWLSGFTGSAGRLLIGRETASLATDFRYWTQAPLEATLFTVFQDDRSAESRSRWLAGSRLVNIGFDGAQITLNAFSELQQTPGFRWTQLDKPLAPLRAVKSPAEIALIGRAAAFVDDAMADVTTWLQAGLTERAVAWALEKRLREAGAEALAFDIIVASGPHAAFPHHRPGERVIRTGEPIIVDVGAQIAGYRSDLTRTFFLGPPDDRFRTLYELVHRAQQKAMKGMQPGMTGRAVDSLARDVIAGAGYGSNFGHGLGHGVGLEIHEAPSLSQRADDQTLEPGMVVTVEPGIYIPEWGGIRIEDLVVVTDTAVTLISHAPYNPFILST